MAVIRDPLTVEGRRGTLYPAEFAQGFEGRIKRALGNAGGLTQFGVNLTTLEPGAMSAHRHWHAREDEDAEYPDIDLRCEKRGGKFVFMHKSGEPYP